MGCLPKAENTVNDSLLLCEKHVSPNAVKESGAQKMQSCGVCIRSKCAPLLSEIGLSTTV